jgi:hypothetical protein
MLKRIGAGATAAWSAPVLTSIRAPALAQSSCFIFDCGPGVPTNCPDPVCEFGPFFTVENGCFCASVYLQEQGCVNDSDCPPIQFFGPPRCAPAVNCRFPRHCLYCAQSERGRQNKRLRILGGGVG